MAAAVTSHSLSEGQQNHETTLQRYHTVKGLVAILLRKIGGTSDKTPKLRYRGLALNMQKPYKTGSGVAQYSMRERRHIHFIETVCCQYGKSALGPLR